MDAVLLRTLTEKSYLKFGQFQKYRVGEVLIMGQKKYLRWVYFNCSMINFNDELLDKLNITEDFRIPKPGTEPEKYKQLTDLIYGALSPNNSLYTQERNAIKSREHFAKEGLKNLNRDKVYFSKSSLQAINQGHKRN